VIVDASVVLSAFFPDEAQEQAQALIGDHVIGKVELAAPTLLVYEVTNGVLQARRRGRIDEGQAADILSSFEGLRISLQPVRWQEMLPMAVRFGRSAYDAAYLALAEARGQRLVTADIRMCNAVRAQVDWVWWVGEYGNGVGRGL
jgi:predicted nucleic acid-binding protein